MVNFGFWSKENDGLLLRRSFMPSVTIPPAYELRQVWQIYKTGIGREATIQRMELGKTMCEIALYGLLFQGGLEQFSIPPPPAGI